MGPGHRSRDSENTSFADASILLIGEDNDALASSYDILNNSGFNVRSTDTGYAAIQSAEGSPPDLIIIDGKLREPEAVEMCGQLSANSQLQHIPILIIGPRDNPALMEQAFEAGSMDWLDTPVQTMELMTKVKAHLDLQQLRNGRAKLERQLARTKEQAEAAIRAKSNFLSHMSHELRTPLNAILGFSRLMERNPNLTETQAENLGLIYQSGENLLRLINDVLDMSKIDAGNETLQLTVIDLPQLMQGVSVKFQSRAADKGLTFSLDLSPDLPRFIKCDENKLQQIMINLVGNSLKFTQTGGIEIKIRRQSDEKPRQTEGPCNLVFEIRDTGSGIAPGDLNRIFDPFFKGKSYSTSTRGTGLGLTISRNYARLMEGDITAANCRDKGACFTFHVCVESSTAQEALPLEGPERIIGVEPGNIKCRVLVVDDDNINRMLLSELLMDVSLDVKKAEDGEKAVKLFSQWNPDIVLMDIRMPVMDGMTATKHIKATEMGRDTPIVALTGQTYEEDRLKIAAAGFDDYLRKPFEEQQLFDIMAKHLDVTFIRDKSHPPEESPSVKEEAITIDVLAQLPTPLLTELRKIALELDLERFKWHLEQIQSSHPEIGASLSKLSNNFRFEEIYNLCGAALRAKG